MLVILRKSAKKDKCTRHFVPITSNFVICCSLKSGHTNQRAAVQYLTAPVFQRCPILPVSPLDTLNVYINMIKINHLPSFNMQLFSQKNPIMYLHLNC